jgi:hypothetical protein
MVCRVVRINKANPDSWYVKYVGKKLRIYGRVEATILHSNGKAHYVAVHNSKPISVDDATVTK